MNSKDIESQVIAFIEKTVHQENPVEVKASTRFEDLGLDSLDVAQLLFEAEDAFGISFDLEKASDITCIGDIAAYIAKHQDPEPASVHLSVSR
jgi:acyl carrier protein